MAPAKMDDVTAPTQVWPLMAAMTRFELSFSTD
jgi:hypothetical protein